MRSLDGSISGSGLPGTGAMYPEVSSGGKFVHAGGIYPLREGECPAESQRNGYLGGNDESMRIGIAVGTLGKIAVEGCYYGIGLALILGRDIALPLAYARAAGVRHDHGPCLAQCRE